MMNKMKTNNFLNTMGMVFSLLSMQKLLLLH